MAAAVLTFAAPTLAFADTSAVFTLPSGVRVKIVEAPFEKSRFKVEGGTPEQFGSYLAAERKRWGEIIQKQGIKLN